MGLWPLLHWIECELCWLFEVFGCSGLMWRWRPQSAFTCIFHQSNLVFWTMYPRNPIYIDYIELIALIVISCEKKSFETPFPWCQKKKLWAKMLCSLSIVGRWKVWFVSLIPSFCKIQANLVPNNAKISVVKLRFKKQWNIIRSRGPASICQKFSAFISNLKNTRILQY